MILSQKDFDKIQEIYKILERENPDDRKLFFQEGNEITKIYTLYERYEISISSDDIPYLYITVNSQEDSYPLNLIYTDELTGLTEMYQKIGKRIKQLKGEI